MAYYQHNSLGSSFPGVDTTLRYPYRDMIEGSGSVRSRSTSTTPAPPVPSPRNVGRTASPTADSNSSQLVERWADVLFAFHAEYPDELTIDVCIAWLFMPYTQTWFVACRNTIAFEL